MQMKQPAWESMPVLDVRGLNEEQLAALEAAYDEVFKQPLAPLAQLAHDPVRQKIDDVISSAMDLPSFKPVRELLAREPGLTGREISPRTTLEPDRAVDQESATPTHGFSFEDDPADEA